MRLCLSSLIALVGYSCASFKVDFCTPEKDSLICEGKAGSYNVAYDHPHVCMSRDETEIFLRECKKGRKYSADLCEYEPTLDALECVSGRVEKVPAYDFICTKREDYLRILGRCGNVNGSSQR